MKQQKTRRAKTLFTLVALLVVLMSNVYVGRAIEPDPRILWVADSSIGIINGFALHPNGNVFAYKNYLSPGGVWSFHLFEIDGKTGKVIKKYPIITDYLKTQIVEQLDISDDGQYLALRGGYLYEFQTEKIYKFGNANYVKFIPNTNILAYHAWNEGPTQGHDSSIVILNIETKERKTIYTEEVIWNIAFSPDGKYMATAGTKEKSDGNYYTVFKLWDAQKLTLIKELKRYDNENFQIPKIEFSNDNNLVAFFSNIGIMIFDTKEFNIFKHYTKSGLGINFSRFTFIGSEYLGIQSEKTSILRFSNDTRIDIYEFPTRAFMMETNQNQSILYAGTGYSDLGGAIIAWDLNQIFSDVEENNIKFTFETKYHNGILNIRGFVPISNTFAIEIFDITGNLIKQLDLPIEKSELNIPLKLPIGTYLINITSAYKKLSSKFIVTK